MCGKNVAQPSIMANWNEKLAKVLKLTVLVALVAGRPALAAESGERIFAFTPSQTAEQESSDFFSGHSVVVSAATVVEVQPYVLATTMTMTPRAINPPTPARSRAVLDASNVEIKLRVPSFIARGDVQLSAFQLNGYPITAVKVPSTRADLQPDTYRFSPGFVHVFFNRQEVLSILGPSVGERTVVLEAGLGGGHFIRATDTIKMS
jgi:hypothetical protein